MDFTFFKTQISKIENLQLPGESSHHKMMAPQRIQELKKPKKQTKSPKKAGVMALFYPGLDSKTKLVLILRKTYNGVHSNQIAFPGGKFEKEDKNIEETALRETYEEIGVAIEKIKVIKAVTQVYIPPSNFLVSPFIGLVEENLSFVKEIEEVEEIIEVSVVDFLKDNNCINSEISTSYSTKVMVPAFALNGYIVWGATAMILSEIKVLLKQVL